MGGGGEGLFKKFVFFYGWGNIVINPGQWISAMLTVYSQT